MGVSEEGNIYHLHVKTFLMRHLNMVNKHKAVQKRLHTAQQNKKILSVEARVATIVDGIVSRA